jgi:hypothetical protein
MSVERIKGYLLTVVGGLPVLAAVVLVTLQWGNSAEISFFGKIVPVNIALLMALSALCGVVFVWLVKIFYSGMSALHRTRKPKPEQPAPPAECCQSQNPPLT